MKIGLIDVDGHNWPNLALMKLSAWHKAQGDTVEWHFGWSHYDVVYMSKIFSDTYSQDAFTPANVDAVIRGGSGYAIRTVSGVEIYDPAADKPLPEAVEHMMPDYSLYPGLTKDTAYGRLTIGCPKRCAWCHVCAMQSAVSRRVADLGEFWQGQRNITLLDPNILACVDREQLLLQLMASNARINFSQGLDIQRMDSDVIALLNRCKISRYHFAWDDPSVDLTDQFAQVGDALRVKSRSARMAYVLVNFGPSSMDDALERIYILRSLNFDPYVMIYNKPNAPRIYRDLQRWCNNKVIFGAVEYFDDYLAAKGDRNE